MTPAGKGQPGRRVQYAALPYRVRGDNEVEVRLITSRETRRWVLPKGWPIKGLSPARAAARETYEEAGLLGTVAREAIGMYTYEKRIGLRSILCDVLVYPLRVKRHLKKWPERSQRFGFWFTIESAAAAVQEPELSALILSFGDQMAKKFAEKAAAAARSKAAGADKAQTAVPEAPVPEAAPAAPAKAGKRKAPPTEPEAAARKKGKSGKGGNGNGPEAATGGPKDPAAQDPAATDPAGKTGAAGDVAARETAPEAAAAKRAVHLVDGR